MFNLITKDGYKLSVTPDTEPEDPRSWWDIPPTESESGLPMFFIEAAHSRYNMSWNLPSRFKDVGEFVDWKESEEANPESKWRFVPIYMYEHSGIALSWTPFNDYFDSGLLGFLVYYNDQTLADKIGIIDLRCLEQTLKGIVSSYFRYVEGDVWEYTIEDLETGDIVDGCCGFLSEEECIAECKSSYEAMDKCPVSDRRLFQFVYQISDLSDPCNTFVGKMHKYKGTLPEFETALMEAWEKEASTRLLRPPTENPESFTLNTQKLYDWLISDPKEETKIGLVESDQSHIVLTILKL